MIEISAEAEAKNEEVLESYNAKWSGEAGPKTRELYTKACQGMNVDESCALQDHVLAKLGYIGAPLLNEARMSPETKAWVAWMVG